MNKDITLYQDNVITRTASNMSELERNILYMVISQINEKDATYFVSAAELMERTGNKELNFTSFQEATKSLVNHYFETTLPNGNFLQGNFVAAAEYHKGKGIIEIEIAKLVKPYYLNLKEKFTTYQLNAAMSISGKYAKRMYEILSMYKNFPNPSATLDVADLKRMLSIIDLNGRDLYPKFTHFKTRILDPATAEINKKTEIKFEWKENYGKSATKGRKPISTITFNIMKAQNQKELYPNLSLRLTKEFRLTEKQAATILSTFPIPEITKKLYDISLSKTKIANIGAYTAKSFNV